jgi:Dolichyl-phosphate-mannose-protein mannosyltransferase
MTVRGLSISRSTLILLIVFALALGLRLWGVNFGLPFVYHPDEGALTMPALNILRTGDYRPIRLDYGSAYIYALTALYIPYFLYGAWRGYFTTVADLPVFADYHRIGAYAYPAVFLLPRVLTALLGALSVLVVFSLAKRLGGPRAGLIAAALLAIMSLHVSNSHFATVDVPMTFVLMLAMTRILDVYERGDWRDYVWAGILVGLCASTKFTGGVGFVALLVAHFLRARDGSQRFNHRLAIGAAATAGGFLIGTPYALDLPYFLNWLAVNVQWYGSAAGEPGVAIGDPTWFFYLKELVWNPSILIVVAGAVGIGILARRDWRRGFVLLAFPVAYGVLIVSQASRFPRFLVPILPFLSLGAGIALDTMAGWLRARWHPANGRAKWSIIALLALVGVFPFAATIQQDALLAVPDVRTVVFDWYKANISPEAKVAADPTGPPLFAWSRDVYVTWNLAEHSSEWYAEQQFDYLILSEPILLSPNLTAQTRSAYDRLLARLTLVKTFQGPMLGTDGLHIWVYRIKP